MKKKYFFLYIFFMFLFFSCSTEFKPSGNIPDSESRIEEIFVDTIEGMTANIKLDFINDSCRSISASYGDKNVIYYQIIKTNNEITDSRKCFERFIIPKFDDFKRVSKNKNNFNLFAENDSILSVSWIKQEYVFYMTCNKEQIENAVSYFNYLEFK